MRATLSTTEVHGATLGELRRRPAGLGVRADFSSIYRAVVAVNGNTNAPIPLFAIGVFTGFTLSQAGLVRHWHKARLRRWWVRAAVNGTGAVMTAVATGIFLASKVTAGAWVVVLAIAALMVLFRRIDAYHTEVSAELGLGAVPAAPRAEESLVVVAVNRVSRLRKDARCAAPSLGSKVVAASVAFEDDQAAQLRADWERWHPGAPLVALQPAHRSIAGPIVAFITSPEVAAHARVLVLIPEVEPRRWRHQLLQNQRGVILANLLRRRTDVAVATLPFRLAKE